MAAPAAHYVKKGAAELDVTLIERNPIYSSSFFSNLYIGGFRTLESLNHAYEGLRRLGVEVVHDVATDVDLTKKTVKTRGGHTYSYDRLVLSPGIDVKYDSIPGYSREASRIIPHAYTTSAEGKRVLKSLLMEMPDGGTVVLTPPNNPYRCPPAPYERACMIAHLLKTRKPKSKLIILDPKKAFSKQGVFVEAFDKYYKGIIELNLTTEIDDYAVVSLDPKTKEIVTKAGKKVKADVANIIPQQRAGEIAVKAGCTEGDWCPINPENFSSKKVKDVYVLGDAAIAAEMPKSAFSANSQAKVVAEILAELAKKEKFPARYRNICWSLLAPDDNVKVGANYAPKDGKLDPSGSFVSQKSEAADVRKQNYQESIGWYAGIHADMFGLERVSLPPEAVVAPIARPAIAGRRIALAIGNSVYANAPRLKNPANDTLATAAALRRLGFAETIERYDLGNQQLRDELKSFGDKAASADWAVVYFAGHGIQVNQTNYLIPTDAKLVRACHVEDEAVALPYVLSKVEDARQLRLVILDACRTNPFLARIEQPSGSRSLGRGLGRIEPQRGVLVAYAARDGQLAEDGGEGNSPFTKALLEHIEEPGLEIGLLFRKVRDAVLKRTGQAQEPFVYGSLPSEGLYFRSSER